MDCVWHPIEFSAEIESRSRSRCRNFNESNSISEVSEFVDVVHKSQIIQIISIVFFFELRTSASRLCRNCQQERDRKKSYNGHALNLW